jgi:hypothetical protein
MQRIALLAWQSFKMQNVGVIGVLGDFLGDARHFCRAPHKCAHVALEEVDELTFLFGVQTDLDLYGFGRVSSIDLHGLGVLGHFESVERQGHSWAMWH